MDYIEIERHGDRIYIIAGDNICGYMQKKLTDYYNVENILKDVERQEIIETIGVNAKHLDDALKSINLGGKFLNIARIEIRKPNEPLVIRSGEKNIKIIFPVHIKENN